MTDRPGDTIGEGETMLEQVACALSIPQHHTTWDILSEPEKDLFRRQADYGLKAISAEIVEALDMLVRVVDESNPGAGLAITNASLLRGQLRARTASSTREGL